MKEDISDIERFAFLNIVEVDNFVLTKSTWKMSVAVF